MLYQLLLTLSVSPPVSGLSFVDINRGQNSAHKARNGKRVKKACPRGRINLLKCYPLLNRPQKPQVAS